MNKQTSSFKIEAEKIRVQPPRSAWKRIEAQLDAEGSRRKIKIARLISYAAAIVARLISYAAAIVLLVVFASIGLFFSTSNAWDDSNLYSLSLEALPMDSPDDTSIYNVEKVKDLTAYFAGQ